MNKHSPGKRKVRRAVAFLGFLGLLFIFCQWADIFQKGDGRKVQQESSNLPTLACIFKGEIKRNESLYLSLLRKKLPHQLIHQLTSSLKGKFDLRRSLPGDSYTLLTTPDSILFFEYQKGMERKCKVIRENGEIKAEVKPLEFDCLVQSVQGEIDNSLWMSMIDLCESPELIMKLTEVFEWEIDFLTEPRKGDKFRLIFEEYRKDGRFIRYGDILAAEYTLGDKTHQAVLYQSPEGKKSYYNPTGKSVKKVFLKSPLNYRRISSRFSYRRFHPIFKRYQPHLGVDYAAPRGTPVVASGDGRVIYAGWKRGFGKIVEIRHPNGFITSYGHLSRFAKGIRKWTKVKQKQLIGYVGNTGASTGPHLDYRVKANGRYVNPLRMVAPPVDPVKEEHLPDFKRKRDNLLYAMDILTNSNSLVSLGRF
jgi:murein DD-endopeptidase MepM/ murein hydrolase activator NlpD